MGAEDWLRAMSDTELKVVVSELEARAEQFDAKLRSQINDELRRRRMPLVNGARRW